MSDYTRVYFEGLGIDFDVPSVAFTIGSYSIHWYGIIIAFGFALAVLYGGRMAYKWKMSLDGMTNVLMWGTILGIVFARAYYVIFEWSYYKRGSSSICTECLLIKEIAPSADALTYKKPKTAQIKQISKINLADFTTDNSPINAPIIPPYIAMPPFQI